MHAEYPARQSDYEKSAEGTLRLLPTNTEVADLRIAQVPPLLPDADPVQQQIQGPLSGIIPVECLTYSVKQTAMVLGVDKSTVYNLITRGFFAPLEGLRHKRLPKKEVHDYVDGRLVPKKRNFSASTFSPASASSWNGKKRRIRRKSVGAANDPKQQERTP